MKHILYTIFTIFIIQNTFAQKIILSEKNLINISAKGDATTLVDEQALAGDPQSGNGGSPETVFTNGYVNADIYYPLEIVIDLLAVHAVTDFCFYDLNSSDSLTIAIGTPGHWINVGTLKTDSYKVWKQVSINQNTRYIYLRFKSPQSLISEIVIYGTPIEPIVPPNIPSPPSGIHPLMEDFIGINSFNDVPDSIQKVVKQIREYHSWGWDEGNTETTYPGFPNNQYGWNPSWASGANWAWNFDKFYGNAFKSGTTISPALNMCAPYIVNYDGNKSNNKPIAPGEASKNPLSYKEHADWMFQFAARYGSKQVSPSLLKLRADNPVKSGLGYIKYMENWNEPDKYWKGRDAYFTPFEYAAMSSADYDGHQGQLGNTFGLKNADPSIKMVLAGLSSIDTMYIKSMLFWAEHFRNGSFPFDVINFHHYSTDGGGQDGDFTTGVSPEQDKLKERIAALVAFRDQYLPKTEVWLSEFGYDTHPGSKLVAPAIGEQSNWETQARWLIRSYLAIVAGGADKAQMYMIRDVDGSSSTVFSSSGLTTAKKFDGVNAPYTQKNAWYYLYTFRKRLTGYRFKEEINSGNPNVLIYAFEKASNTDSLIYAIWAPTSSDLTVENYVLNIPQAASISKVELTNKDTTGVETALPIVNKKVTLEVDEKPDLLLIKKTAVVSGKASLKKKSFSVYPNPFKDYITIKLPENGDGVATITTVDGLIVKKEKLRAVQTKIQLSNLPSGFYTLNIKTNADNKVFKIMKP